VVAEAFLEAPAERVLLLGRLGKIGEVDRRNDRSPIDR